MALTRNPSSVICLLGIFIVCISSHIHLTESSPRTLWHRCYKYFCSNQFMKTCKCAGSSLESHFHSVELSAYCTQQDFDTAFAKKIQLRISDVSNEEIELIMTCKLHAGDFSEKTKLASGSSQTIIVNNLERSKRANNPLKRENFLIPMEQPLNMSNKYYDEKYLDITHHMFGLRLPNFAKEHENDSEKVWPRKLPLLPVPGESQIERRKRSALLPGQRRGPLQRTFGIKWQLVDRYDDASRVLGYNEQRDEIRLALATWERSSNLCFIEDPLSQNIDLRISFLAGQHSVGGAHNFQGTPAHTKSREYIHLNRDWRWILDETFIPTRLSSSTAILRTVLQHEVGHYIGLPHSGPSPIMARAYNMKIDAPALSGSDLVNLQEEYGRCSGTLDILVDIQWVTTRRDGTVSLFYRSIITRRDLVWQYSNLEGRPYGNYPLAVSSEFPRLNFIPTAIFQIYTYNEPNYVEDVFVIGGNIYRKYEATVFGMTDKGETGNVEDFGIPRSSNVNSAVYDYRKEKIHFFVGSRVHEVSPIYNSAGSIISYQRDGTYNIGGLYPSSTSQPAHPNKDLYKSGVDSVYIHVSGEMYLTKGLNIWQNVAYSNSKTDIRNEVVYLGTQGSPTATHLWDYLCDPFRCK